MARENLGQRLIATNGRPSGFDYLRLWLAISVIFVHCPTTTTGIDPFLNTPLNSYFRAVLPMFFALSGFLVAGSLERSKTLLTFLGLRVIRIYPALAVEVVLSAFLIGAAVTTYPLAEYFSHPQFFLYLRNAIGNIHFLLPGVFVDNPWRRMVNYQLWTIPFELLSYVLLTALVLFGGLRRKFLIPLGVVILALAHLVLRMRKYDWDLPPSDSHFSGSLLVLCFLAGLTLYLYRDKIAWSFGLGASALLASFFMLWIGRYLDYLAIVTISYAAVSFGLTNVKRLPIIKGADYSYGMYLYGFVIQQLFVYLAAPRFWWLTALVCIPLAALFAAFSWHFVEKPAQRLRRPLARAEQSFLALKSRLIVESPWRLSPVSRSEAIDPRA